MKFSKGDRVRHPGKPEWDTGQVLEDCLGQDVRVYFAGAGEKKLRLDYVTLSLVEGEAAAHPVLDSLGKRPPRSAASAAKRGKKTPRTRPVAQLVEDFLKIFPGGFHDQKYLRDERTGKDKTAGPKVDKVKAHDLMTASLSREQMDALIAAGDHAEVGRRALRVIGETDLVFPREAISLRNALQTEENQRAFAESLRALLYGEADAGTRFAAFCDRLAALGAAKWPLATYFPFVAFPEREMFLKPTVTRRVAEMLGFELNYSVEPNWLTYSKLLELSRYLFDSLAGLRPRDMIDVQSFIWCVANYDEGEHTQPPPGEADEADGAGSAGQASAGASGEAAGGASGEAAGTDEPAAPPAAAASPDARADDAQGPDEEPAGAEVSPVAADAEAAVISPEAAASLLADTSAEAGTEASTETGAETGAEAASGPVGVSADEDSAGERSAVEGSAGEGSADEGSAGDGSGDEGSNAGESGAGARPESSGGAAEAAADKASGAD